MDPSTAYHPAYPLPAYPAPYPSQYAVPQIAPSYHHALTPYSITNEYTPYQHSASQFYYTPQRQMYPQLMTNSSFYTPIAYDPPWYTTFWESCCCCFGCGPQSEFEAYHRDQIERMKYFEKKEKQHRRSMQQQQKLMEEQRLASIRQQSAKQPQNAASSHNEQSNTKRS